MSAWRGRLAARLRRYLLAAWLALALPLASPPAAATGVPAEGSEPVLQTVLVTGAQPGPGLWQVRHGENRMWVVGTLVPSPRDIDWQSGEVLEAVAGADVVLTEPGLRVDPGIGAIRGLFLMPSMLKVRRNPGRARLADVLPAPLYARWAERKQRYLPRNRRIERWRPIAAASELRVAAARSAGLEFSDPVTSVVLAAAREQGIPLQSTTWVVKLDLDKPRQRLRELARTPLDDHDCFARTLDALDADIALQGRLANAWAVGDLDELRQLRRVDPTATCLRAALDHALFAEVDIEYEAVIQQLRSHWLAQAEQALAAHRSSVALLSINQVLAEDGLLAQLAARGYTVIAPDQDDPYEIDDDPADADADDGVRTPAGAGIATDPASLPAGSASGQPLPDAGPSGLDGQPERDRPRGAGQPSP